MKPLSRNPLKPTSADAVGPRRQGPVRLALTVAVVMVALFSMGLWRRPPRPGGADPERMGVVFSGPLEVWSSYEGVLEARHMERIAAPIDGSAVLIELAPEGLEVQAGDVLARFDMADAEAERVRLEHERTRIATELAGLRDAELPLERLDLDAQVFDAAHALEAEHGFEAALRDLTERGLVAEEEAERQSARVAGLQARFDQARMRRDLTMAHVHPARLARAEAALASVEAQIRRAERRLDNGRVRAPSAGVVVHLPLPLGGVFRTAHVGDTLHRNQAFMALPDMRDPVVRFRIPESDLPRVAPGAPARIRPVAFPDRTLEGEVEYVGAMAQAVPGESSARKGFPVRVAVAALHEALPAGITVRVNVQSYAHPEALQVPRAAVFWREGIPWVRLHADGNVMERRIRAGWFGETVVEVLEGLEPGDQVEWP